ncbi:glycosyltransferase family 4 protein [Francisellaceae bacterium]|nr:glycosyltransferase family 4 protein [Francisellaceae bacterium]
MNIVILASYAPSILNFRKELVLSLKKYGKVTTLVPYESEDMKHQIQSLGVDYQEIPLSRRGLNPLKDIKLLKFLVRFHKKNQTDLVIGYTVKPVIYGSIAAKIAKVPSIYSIITGLGFAFIDKSSLKQKLIQKLIQKLYKNTLKYNQTVFFQNPDDLNLFRQLKILPKTAATQLINGSGVNLDYFEYKKDICLAPIRFLMIARIMQDKGVVEFIQAAKQVKQDYGNVEFHLVGFMDESNHHIEQLINQCVEKKIINFHGELQDVRSILAQCSVYVLPSYREGTPRSVLEAMSTGRAIITTDAPGCRETVQEGHNGYLVPIKYANHLAEAMIKLIETPDKIIEMGKNSRQLVEEKYDVHKVNQVILKTIGLLND